MCLVALYHTSIAQSASVANFASQFKKHGEATTIRLEGLPLRLAARFAIEHTEVGRKVQSKLHGLYLFSTEEGEKISTESHLNLVKSMRNQGFEELMVIRDGTSNIQFYMQERKGKIENLVMLLRDESDYTIIQLNGELLLDDLQHLDIEMNGGEQFKQIKKSE